MKLAQEKTGLHLQLLCLFIIMYSFGCKHSKEQGIPHYNMVGKVDQTSAILQTRLTTSDTLVIPLDKGVPGQSGFAKFEWATDTGFTNATSNSVMRADSSGNFIIKSLITDLEPSTRYYYRTWTGKDNTRLVPGSVCTFKTLPDSRSLDTVRFVVLSCMNFEKFYGLEPTGGGGEDSDAAQPATRARRAQGFPGFEVLNNMDLHFWVGNGDNVYYDKPPSDSLRAKSREELRAKWHRQFSVPTLKTSLEQFATHWQVDDHDYRFNDADTTDHIKALPSHELGMATFREQLPVTIPGDEDNKTYYTIRPNRWLQVWFVEGRAYRSPNNMEDGPEKSIWGDQQKEWLKSTMAESDAAYKLLISPTPMVGPDDAYKNDNHTNPGGFQYERDAFFDWLDEQGMINDFYIITGDRHWQYHSVHPRGIHEFSSGAFVAQNARLGREPGDPKSTDPNALIRQPFLQGFPTGGFVNVSCYGNEQSATLQFQVISEKGNLLYEKVFNTED